MCEASSATSLILSALSAQPKQRSKLSEMCTWFATMPVSPVAAASTTSRSKCGGGFWTSTLWASFTVCVFLPHIRAHGEGGHIVNTASMAGLQSGLGFSPYATSKFAVVAMSEGLAMQLKPLGIGVTVLCPGFV